MSFKNIQINDHGGILILDTEICETHLRGQNTHYYVGGGNYNKSPCVGYYDSRKILVCVIETKKVSHNYFRCVNCSKCKKTNWVYVLWQYLSTSK